MKKTKRVLLVILLFGILLLFTACDGVIPPKEYARRHYSYEDAVAYAKALDPDATVSETCTVVYEDHIRDRIAWPAVINGIDCDIVSIRSFYGELMWPFYDLASDYEYCLLEKIVSEKQPQWEVKDPGNLYHPYLYRYSAYRYLYVETPYALREEELPDEKLEEIWQGVCEIAAAYEAQEGSLRLEFGCAAMPYLFKDGEKEYISLTRGLVREFTEEAKQAFFADYRESWKRYGDTFISMN